MKDAKDKAEVFRYANNNLKYIIGDNQEIDLMPYNGFILWSDTIYDPLYAINLYNRTNRSVAYHNNEKIVIPQGEFTIGPHNMPYKKIDSIDLSSSVFDIYIYKYSRWEG